MKSAANAVESIEQRYVAGELGRNLEFNDRTLPSILQIQAGLGDKVMIKSPERELSYADAVPTAAAYAGKLIACGIKPGDRVAVFADSRIEVLELWLGTAWAGAILVPINTAFRGEQLRHSIKLCDPTLIIAEGELLDSLATVQEAIETVNTILVFSGNTQAISSIGRVPVAPFVTDATPAPAHQGHPSDTAAILYTSGTTGPSKAVLCPHGQFYWWGVYTGESLGLGQDDVLFTVLPFFHTNALNALWQSLLFGATYTFSTRFSASRFWQLAKENDATITYLLGAMAQILLKLPPADIDSEHRIRNALCPATPIEAIEAIRDRFGIKLIEGYGSTETNLIFSNVIDGYFPCAMGHVVPGYEIRIVDENDCDVAEGDSGELIIRNTEPFSMASGYFGNPEATVKAWRNLWFHTGDRVYKNKETGVYYFLDRLIDAIRRRGENISSWEVEFALMQHPDIEAAAVVGVASDLGSEQDVMTFIVGRNGVDVDKIEVIRFLESRLAYFAIPRYWDVLETMPITENGKVKKAALRERGITQSTWDREKAGVTLNRHH